jgi:hypothetical protein
VSHWRRQLREEFKFEGPPTFEALEDRIRNALWASDAWLANQVADHLYRSYVPLRYPSDPFEREHLIERQGRAFGMWSITLALSTMKRTRASIRKEKRERKQRGF